MLSKNADSYKLDDNRLSGQTIYRTNPTQQELKWERMKDTLKARRSRILDPVISKITVRIALFLSSAYCTNYPFCLSRLSPV